MFSISTRCIIYVDVNISVIKFTLKSTFKNNKIFYYLLLFQYFNCVLYKRC